MDDAQAKAYRHAMLVGKWEGLITDDMTAENMGELRYERIFGKRDMATYGR